jgi:hypothetical protein
MSLKTYEQRTASNGRGQEETLGVNTNGFYDASNEFPLYEYKHSTSLNKSTLGQTINNLDIGGSIDGVDFDISSQGESIYPYNQAKTTSSGHTIETDDTLGSERVLIKHRSGAGVELKSDGSVVIVAKHNKIEVTGGNQTTIIEGNGDVVYKGNLNLKVTGDMNLDVGGDYNVNVGGNVKETYMHNVDTTIIQNEVRQIKGRQKELIQGDVYLKYGSTMTTEVNDDVKLYCSSSIYTVASINYNIDADSTDLSFNRGSIGGSSVDFTGKTATAGCFHGDLTGKADAANQADFATTAGQAPSGSAGSPGSNTNVDRTYTPSVDIEDIEILALNTEYYSLADHIIPLDEVRSKLRDPSNMANSAFVSAMIAEGALNPNFNGKTLMKTVRSSGNEPIARKGETPLGSTPPTFENKRFIP